LETAGHHREAVASGQLPVHGKPGQVASKDNCKRTNTAFESAGVHNPLGSLKIHCDQGF
jgi:hypothetical protein